MKTFIIGFFLGMLIMRSLTISDSITVAMSFTNNSEPIINYHSKYIEIIAPTLKIILYGDQYNHFY